ncbi:MAG: T9SS type A sorting domain-containing protein, partial [Bacteroidales bacterium]|nr:T9SS type A sorting domain-containing protein [Bacteroidales bacterium]
IAMITTARTTSGSASLLYRTYKNMFRMKDGEYQTMGEIFYQTKQNGESNPSTKVFVLFGDPALRLAYPKYNVVLTKINGKQVSIANDTLKALSTVELHGEVRDNFGVIMDGFNGDVTVSVYDKENIYRTHGDQGGPVMDFKLRNSILFSGKAAVVNGEFDIRFMLPKDINYAYGKGLINFYATNYVVDANCSYENVIVGGYNSTALPDVDGPDARIFIDDTLFVSGGITNESPLFFAYVKDPNGINATGAGIGHDITATLSGATNRSYNLNSYYDAPDNINDYGTIAYRFYNLNEGHHCVNFKVWDIYNNSTTVSIDFTVVKSSSLTLENVFNAPNPMNGHTNFYFEHNQKGEFDVTVRIYNINGQLVKTIKESRYGTSGRIDPIYWDGTSDNGSPLQSGIYIYNMTLSTSKEEKVSSCSKLVIAR